MSSTGEGGVATLVVAAHRLLPTALALAADFLAQLLAIETPLFKPDEFGEAIAQAEQAARPVRACGSALRFPGEGQKGSVRLIPKDDAYGLATGQTGRVTELPNTPVTVVLVHGAFADSSSWNAVIPLLQARGVRVTAAPNPLRGIAIDSAYVASFLEQVPGPVLAVAHSYGGAVVTNAAARAKNVVGLVYVAAFAPDEGERLGQVARESKDSVLNSALVPFKFPTGDGGTAQEFAIDPAKVRDAFAADLPDDQIAIIGATQRPISELAFSDASGPPAWKTLPAWAVVPSGDKAVGTDLVRSMAKRAGATITEVEGSHVIMLSKPQVVTDVILTALEHVSSKQPLSV